MRLYIYLLLFGVACSNAEFDMSLDGSDRRGGAADQLAGSGLQGAKGRIITSGSDLPDGWRTNALPNSMTVEFDANPTEEKRKVLRWGNKQQSEVITLAARRARIGAQRITQLARIPRSTEVRQTHSNKQTITKSFDAKKAGILDILMVIDNSNDKSGRVLGVDLATKNIDHHKLANKLEGLLSGNGPLSGIDWKLVLATSNRYRKNISPLIRGRYQPGQAEEFKQMIKSFANDSINYPAWETQREKPVWKARKVMGDVDQPDSKAWKGYVHESWKKPHNKTYAGTTERQSQNFYPYSVWRNGEWVKSDDFYSKHSWMREHSSLAVILISDEDLQNNRSPTSYYGLAADTRIAGKGPWDSFYAGMKEHIVKDMNWHKPPRDGQAMWRLYGVFDTQTTCNDLNFSSPNTKYYKKHVWEHPDNNSTVGLMNPCFDCTSLNNLCHALERRVFNSNHKAFANNFLNNKQYFSEIFYLYDDHYALNKVADGIMEILQKDFLLDHHKNEINNMVVKVDGKTLSNSKYKIVGSTLQLSKGALTDQSKKIDVSYKIDKSTANNWVREISLTDKKISKASSISKVKVKIRRRSNGNVVELKENTDWEYVESDEKVKIKRKTAAGTLLISWKETPVKKTNFKIENKNVKITNIVDVIIGNQTITSGFSYDNSSGILTFDSEEDAPNYGQTALVRYTYTTGKKTSYPFNAGEYKEKTLNCNLTCGDDMVANQNIDCTYNAERMRINLNRESELENIDQFEVCYEISDTKPTSIPIPDNVLDDSIELSIGGQVVCSGDQLVVANNAVSLSEANDCDAIHGLQKNNIKIDVAINYTIVNIEEEFVVPEPAVDLSQYSTEYWEVYVNDEQTEDYSRNSRVITFDGLPPESKVKVTVHLLP